MRLNYDEEDKVEVQMSPFDRLRLSATDLLPCDYYDEEVGNANTFITSFNDFQFCLPPAPERKLLS